MIQLLETDSAERRKQQLKTARARYNATPKGVCSNKAYRNSEKVRAWFSEYNKREDVKAKQAARKRAYMATAEGRAKAAEYQRNRRTLPEVRISHRISVGMSRCLRNGKNGYTWESMVGYSRQELMTHLERQFRKGMSWSNMGDWHIDHILPLASFSFETTNDADFKAAWALSNLMPVWARLNQSKGSKREFLL